jgi:hypothetical protein
MKPNPDIALIYHYDLARALAGEVVDWQAIPVNVQAGREGGDLCRAAADFAKRRDLFAMPAPTAVSVAESEPNAISVTLEEDYYNDLIGTTIRTSDLTIHPCGQPRDKGCNHPECQPADADFGAQGIVTDVRYDDEGHRWIQFDWGYEIRVTDATRIEQLAVPAAPIVAVEQPVADPEPSTASTTVPGRAADPEHLRQRVKELVDAGHEQAMRRAWPEGVPTLKHGPHSYEQRCQILAAVRRVEAEVGAGWHPDDGAPPQSRQAIARAMDAWKDRDQGAAWFAASLIATFEQCRNADANLEELVAQFTIEQADKFHDAARFCG